MQALCIVDTLIRNIDTTMAMTAVDDEKKECPPSKRKPGPLLMIPGPIEFDPSVYEALARPTVSHVAPSFIAEFGEALDRFVQIIKGDDEVTPFILSGGGTLGWDCIVSSLCEPELKDRALILNGGYFSDNFLACCEAYGVAVDQIKASCIGDVVTPQQLEDYLSSDEHPLPKLVCITHVDTSVAARTDVAALSAVCRELAPSAFVAVDGVCAFGGEEFRFSEWAIDIAMTASQKAFGTPPGLAMLGVSKRAVEYIENGRKHPIRSYYASLLRWLPIMRNYRARKPSYFSTPNVNLIIALNQSERLLLEEGVDAVVARHSAFSRCFQNAMRAIGLEFVCVREAANASTITAIKVPDGVDRTELLTFCKKERGIIFAGGLHREIKATYFRVGHMGISVAVGSTDLLRCVEAIEDGLQKCGYKFEKGTAVKLFKQQTKEAKLLSDNSKL